MNLSPLAAALHTVLAGLPLPVAAEPDPSAVDEQGKWVIGTAIGDLDRKRLLPTTERRSIRHEPVEPGLPRQARHHSGDLQ